MKKSTTLIAIFVFAQPENGKGFDKLPDWM
jgi:hypothetical protein